jgi:hypothetical protein
MSGWRKRNYRILLSNGEERLLEGESNGLFGISPELTLTHLKSGGKVARFRRKDVAKRVGDYLKDKYFEEFSALGGAVTKNITAEEYELLPEAYALNEKLKADEYFSYQFAKFAVKDRSF